MEGNDITFKNLTIENNAAPLGQLWLFIPKETGWCLFIVVLLGIRIRYIRVEGTRLLFTDCYIEGTTDWFYLWSGDGIVLVYDPANGIHTLRPHRLGKCRIRLCVQNCKLTAAPGVTKVYLGRPWRPYASTTFLNCEFGSHIRPEGWDNWRNKEIENCRYAEFGNQYRWRRSYSRQEWNGLNSWPLKRHCVILLNIFTDSSNWYPYKR